MIENYSKLSRLYRALSQQYLIEQYSLKRLDERFAEGETYFEPLDERNLQQGNGIYLKYISLLNKARIERLEENELKMLREINNENPGNINLADFIGRTYARILAGDITPGTQYEFFKDIYGKGVLPGNAVIFSFRDKTSYGPDGEIDWSIEERKSRIFHQVKEQFEELANAGSNHPVYLVRM